MSRGLGFGSILGKLFLLIVIAVAITIFVQTLHRMSPVTFTSWGYFAFLGSLIFPWGILTLYAASLRGFEIGLAVLTFLASLLSWVGAILIIYAALVGVSHSGSQLSVLNYLLPPIGFAAASAFFAVVQAGAWLPMISTRKRRRVFKLMPTMAAATALLSFELLLGASSLGQQLFGFMRTSAVAMMTAGLGPAVFLITGFLAYVFNVSRSESIDSNLNR